MDSPANIIKTKETDKRVFISSTSFDLIDLRAEVANFLEAGNYKPIWNESPAFPVDSGLHSHDICLETVKNCKIYLLIIDRRFGGIYSGSKFPKENISITWYETKIAFKEEKEMICFVRDTVWTERGSYKFNLKVGIAMKPFHVDNPRVFDFIDYVVRLPRDNWIYPFNNSVELKGILEKRLKIELKRPENIYSLPYFKRIKGEDANE